MATSADALGVRGDVRAVWIANVWPELDAGRFPVKRVVGETFEVSADILREGHEALAAVLKFRTVKDTSWREVPMEFVDNDRWAGRFLLEENTRYLYTLEAYPDPYRAWVADLRKRLAAGMDATSELLEGAALLRTVLPRAAGADRAWLGHRLAEIEAAVPARRAALLLDEEIAASRGALSRSQRRHPLRPRAGGRRRPPPRPRRRLVRDVPALRRGACPAGTGPSATVVDRLPAIAAMGFDVRLPPAHPSDRRELPQGPEQQRRRPAPDDPGSPVGDRQRAGRPQGRRARPRHARGLPRLRARGARARGMEVALDYALQCSPDHPWVREHPEWFHRRPDGTIKYAENPPKKYQDIYPLNFDCRDRRGALGGAARASSSSGSSRACGSSASTTRTPSRSPSGRGSSARSRRSHPDVDLPRRGLHPAEADAGRSPRSASPSRTPTSPGGTSRTS